MTGHPLTNPFAIYIDSAESAPFTFKGLQADAKDEYRPLVVPTQYRCLGRHPDSLGDYSAEGLLEFAHVERKSLEDVQGTVLGWETPAERERNKLGRRDRFEKELENLAKIPQGVVVVEAPLHTCIELMPSWGKKSRALNAKSFARSITSFQQRFKVPWVFCGSRRHAEIETFRWLRRAWIKYVKEAE